MPDGPPTSANPLCESRYVAALPAENLKQGSGRTVHLNGRTIALFNVAGEFFAIDDRCPHRGGPLGAGWVEGCQVFCPLHGWAFDVRTGAGLTNGEAAVRTYPTQVLDRMVCIDLSSDPDTTL